jgi:hypothetical protein
MRQSVIRCYRPEPRAKLGPGRRGNGTGHVQILSNGDDSMIMQARGRGDLSR